MVELLVAVIDFTELTHLLVHVKQFTVGIVERHGDEVGLEQFLVLVCHVLDVLVFVQLVGDVFCGVYYIMRFSMLLFDNGIAVVTTPAGSIRLTLVEMQVHFEVTDDTCDQQCIVVMKRLYIFGQ